MEPEQFSGDSDGSETTSDDEFEMLQPPFYAPREIPENEEYPPNHPLGKFTCFYFCLVDIETFFHILFLFFQHFLFFVYLVEFQTFLNFLSSAFFIVGYQINTVTI